MLKYDRLGECDDSYVCTNQYIGVADEEELPERLAMFLVDNCNDVGLKDITTVTRALLRYQDLDRTHSVGPTEAKIRSKVIR